MKPIYKKLIAIGAIAAISGVTGVVVPEPVMLALVESFI